MSCGSGPARFLLGLPQRVALRLRHCIELQPLLLLLHWRRPLAVHRQSGAWPKRRETADNRPRARQKGWLAKGVVRDKGRWKAEERGSRPQSVESAEAERGKGEGQEQKEKEARDLRAGTVDDRQLSHTSAIRSDERRPRLSSERMCRPFGRFVRPNRKAVSRTSKDATLFSLSPFPSLTLSSSPTPLAALCPFQPLSPRALSSAASWHRQRAPQRHGAPSSMQRKRRPRLPPVSSGSFSLAGSSSVSAAVAAQRHRGGECGLADAHPCYTQWRFTHGQACCAARPFVVRQTQPLSPEPRDAS